MAFRFPDPDLKFPVTLLRENSLESIEKSQMIVGKKHGTKSNFTKFPVIFPVSREFEPETRSIRTTSPASVKIICLFLDINIIKSIGGTK